MQSNLVSIAVLLILCVSVQSRSTSVEILEGQLKKLLLEEVRSGPDVDLETQEAVRPKFEVTSGRDDHPPTNLLPSRNIFDAGVGRKRAESMSSEEEEEEETGHATAQDIQQAAEIMRKLQEEVTNGRSILMLANGTNLKGKYNENFVKSQTSFHEKTGEIEEGFIADMALTDDEKEAALEAIRKSHHKSPHLPQVEKRKAKTDNLWIRKVVPYQFNSQRNWGSDQARMEAQCIEAMQFWMTKTCIQFIPWSTSVGSNLGHDAYIGLGTGSGCSSYVGQMTFSNQAVTLSPQCGLGTACHELGHAMGLQHEHNRDDRDDYVIYKCDRAPDPLDRNYAPKISKHHTNFAPYDLASIMQYRTYSDSSSPLVVKNPDLAFLPPDRTMPDHYDFLTISKLYSCEESCDSSRCKNDGYMLYRNNICQCECVEGLGGSDCTTIDTANGYSCGGIIQLAAGGAKTVINKEGYTTGTKCAWLLKATAGEIVKIDATSFDLPSSSWAGLCMHSLEVRNNLIGQIGRRYCGSQWNEGILSSIADHNSDGMLLLFDASDSSVSAGNGFVIEAWSHSDGCLSSPCGGAPCTPVGASDYTCNLKDQSYSCDFDHGCLCPEVITESSSPTDVYNWHAANDDMFAGSFSFSAFEDNLWFDYTPGYTAEFKLMPANFDQCLSFAYLLKGSEIQVAVELNGQHLENLLVDEGATSFWRTKMYSISAPSGKDIKQVVFRAITSDTVPNAPVYVDSISVVPDTGSNCIPDLCSDSPCKGFPCSSSGGQVTCSYPSGNWECDFETSLCLGLLQDTDDDSADWTIYQGQTPSGRTGPTSAYRGHFYSYVEMSGLDTGNNAVYKFFITSMQDSCVSFKYNMNGANVGDLNVYLVHAGGVKGAPARIMSGDKGDTWFVVEFDVAPNTEVWIEAVRGRSWDSDIAIDDITRIIGTCSNPAPATQAPATQAPVTQAPVTQAPTTQAPVTQAPVTQAPTTRAPVTQAPVTQAPATQPPVTGSWSCDFEQSQLCSGMTQSTFDEFDWTVHSGSTPSGSTGPDGGADGSSWYAFIEASSPRIADDTAWLVVDISSIPPGDACVQVQYHMYGTHIGTFGITHNQQYILVETANKGDHWNEGQCDFIRSSTDSWLFILGMRGGGYKGDIAFDNLVVTEGACDSQTVVTTTAAPVTINGVSAYDGSSLGGLINSPTDSLDFVPTHLLTMGDADNNGWAYRLYGNGQGSIFSPVMQPSQTGLSCIKFHFYQMSTDSHIEYILHVGSTQYLVGDTFGNGAYWAWAGVTTTVFVPYQWELRANTGSAGDLLLDAITIKNNGEFC